MKKLISRFATSRSFASLLSILALAALSFFVLDQAYALPPVLGGGGITNNYKQAPNTNLVCNFADPRSYVQIDYNYDPLSPFFIMETPEGKVVICKEVDRKTGKAVTGDIEFTLFQAGMNPCDLHVSSVVNTDGTTTFTWEFKANYSSCGHEGPELEWDLFPVIPEGGPPPAICSDGKGGFFDFCENKMGVPPTPGVNDFPPRVVGGVTLGQDVVFQYTELQIPVPDAVCGGDVCGSVIRVPGTLILGPCHSGSFDSTADIACVNADGNPTTTVGVVPGTVPPDPDAVRLQVQILPKTFNVRSKGTLEIRIFGNETLNNLSQQQVIELEVNDRPVVTKASDFTYADINHDGYIDIRAKVDMPAFADALLCFGNRPTYVKVSGTLQNGTVLTGFAGFDTIGVVQCPR